MHETIFLYLNNEKLGSDVNKKSKGNSIHSNPDCRDRWVSCKETALSNCWKNRLFLKWLCLVLLFETRFNVAQAGLAFECS